MDAANQPTPQVNYRGDLDIAIVGMAGMFPNSPDLRTFWENIINRLDCIREIPQERWDIPNFFDEDRFARDKVYSKWGGFLESMHFDPMKWKIPPASLLSIDPIQLMSLEVANQAFEDAGYNSKPFPKERTGVIFACAGSHDVGSDYAFRTMLQHYLPRVKDLTPELRNHITEELNATLPEWSEDSFPGFLMNVIAGRIANRFDLGGPNYVVDAACAASLAALHAAIGQLRLKTVDAMLVGGADGTNNPFCYMSFAKTHALSPRGRSRPFDNSADGIALGEGIAALMIRRLEDAERDGDKIYAIIKGIGASSDGRNRSMTAPFPPGQIMAMRRAYDDANIPAASVSLVEAHGTGTAVGDSTEITSLHTLFSEATKDEQYAAVGSVKSMIGHTKTCAGLASLVKTALAIKQRVLPPTINVEVPNEKVDFRHSPFYINTETRPWFDELGEHPRRAGVSAFGFGGTNFHVVMEEYVTAGTSQFDLDLTPRAAELCIWRRTNREELVGALKGLREQIAPLPSKNLGALAHAIYSDEVAHRETQGCRLAIVASSVDDLRAKIAKALSQLETKSSIQDPTGIYYSEAAPISSDRIAYLYPGQGSQTVNMLRDLAVVSQWAHEHFSAANQTLGEFFPIAMTRMIYPPPAFTPEEETERKDRLNATQVAQPALGVVETFGTELLSRFGVTPGGVAGHSYGEYVALYAAGSLSLDDLLSLSGHRGQVAAAASQTCPGAMAAVQASSAQTQKFIDDHKLKVYLANLNAPDQTIIAGSEADLVHAVAQFNAHELRAKRIPVTAAFHTPALEIAAQPLRVVLKNVRFQAPKLPVYSNTLATAYPKKPAEIRKLLQRHIVEPVRFEEQMRQMRADGYEVFIEVGPGRVLTGLLGRIFAGNVPTVLSMDGPGRDGLTQFAHVLAQLAALGVDVQLEPWFTQRGFQQETVVDYAARVVQQSQPKKNDWILSVHGARPVTPLPPRKGLPGDGLRAKFAGKSVTSHTTAGAGSTPADSDRNGHAPHADTNVRVSGIGTGTAVNGTGAPESAPRNGVHRQTPVVPGPAPLPVSPRIPTVAAAQRRTNGVSSSHGVGTHPASQSNGKEPHIAAAVPTPASSTASVSVSQTNGKHPESKINGRQPVAAATQSVPQKPRPIVLPGSSVPLAPAMSVLTDWNQPASAAMPAVPQIPFPHANPPTRLAVSTSQPNSSETPQTLNPAAAQLILQSQALMMQMLDLQKWQQQVALKFVDSHQQLLQGCQGLSFDQLGMAAPVMAIAQPMAEVAHIAAPAAAPIPAPPAPAPAPAAVAPTPAAPAPVAAPVPQVVTTRPAPVAVAPAARPVAAPVAKAPVAVRPVAVPTSAPVATPAPAAVAAPAPVMKAATTEIVPTPTPADGAIPTPAMFKDDLLNAVSERTGYPIDMLDLELPMESGLGIDSIKTVEIFSNLKTYHPYFQQDDQDEEEALKEFTKLKTLGDIISAYELRYQAVTTGGSTPKLTDKTGEEVERYTLSAVEAPVKNGQKKTSHVSN